MKNRDLAASMVRGSKRLCLGLAFALPVGILWACTDDDPVAPSPDASTVDSGTADATADGASLGLACGDAGASPARIFVVQGNPNASELAVVNAETKTVDGRLSFEGSYGNTSSLGTDPYLLGGESDIVTRLSAAEPWKSVATWNVRGDDVVQGSYENANPLAVVQTACNKAYVLRYNRDRIAIIDPSDSVSGKPTGYVDLSALKQAGDPDSVEPTAAVYVPSKKRVYVLLGNANLTKFVKTDVTTLLVCSNLVPSIVAIDVETDQLVNLGGTAPGGGIALAGYNPPQVTSLAYDAAGDRLLVLEGGCNAEAGDGGAGDMSRRLVEEVNLGTGAVKTLLSLNDRGFPSSFALASSDHGAVAFFFDGYHWSTSQTSLGAEITGGIDLVAADRKGAFIGSRQIYLEDGGTGPLQILAVPTDGGAPSVVVEDPFTKPGGYVAGIESWPGK